MASKTPETLRTELEQEAKRKAEKIININKDKTNMHQNKQFHRKISWSLRENCRALRAAIREYLQE